MLYYVRLAAFRRKARENLLWQPGFTTFRRRLDSVAEVRVAESRCGQPITQAIRGGTAISLSTGAPSHRRSWLGQRPGGKYARTFVTIFRPPPSYRQSESPILSLRCSHAVTTLLLPPVHRSPRRVPFCFPTQVSSPSSANAQFIGDFGNEQGSSLTSAFIQPKLFNLVCGQVQGTYKAGGSEVPTKVCRGVRAGVFDALLGWPKFRGSWLFADRGRAKGTLVVHTS
ncbi:hypothetical protein B0H14DRAFT_2606793 [Mycena olivaceomarginata]|nr:hypothetical protein B0H14DRAFT_2606793 [Mycena olivaceomarginata]